MGIVTHLIGMLMNIVNGSDEINEMKIPLEMNFKVVFFKEAKLTDDLKKGDIIYWFDELLSLCMRMI